MIADNTSAGSTLRWPMVRLGELLEPRRPDVTVDPTGTYPFAGVYCFGRGVFRSQERQGSEFSYRTLTQLQAYDFIYPKLMAWEGAFGVVLDACAGCYVSPKFPVFRARGSRLLIRFLGLYFQIPSVWKTTAGGSIGTNVRRRRLHPDDFLRILVPLPPLHEQRRIVERCDQISTKVDAVRALRRQLRFDAHRMMSGVFARLIQNAPRHPMSVVAPLVRRPVAVSAGAVYPELGIRSFGRGTFHKPALPGLEVGSKKLFEIKPGDLVFSNVFAWEGAIAVARDQDSGRFGSHRFITCVPAQETATPDFLRFYFLTDVGLAAIGAASPGGAGRNRTLGLNALSKIEVPVPNLEKQRAFDRLQVSVAELLENQDAAEQELQSLMPAVLDRAFKGAF